LTDPFWFIEEQHPELKYVTGEVAVLFNTALGQEASYELVMRGEETLVMLVSPGELHATPKQLRDALADFLGRLGGQQLVDEHEGRLLVELAGRT
jgi:hypothetical protein